MLKNLKPLKLSVVIPAFNEEDYLADCLKAIFAQTIKPHEIIVVDNNSTDNTNVIAKSFPGVKVVFELASGIEAARDLGFNAATGDIIVRTDADTRPDKNWLERIIRTMTVDVHAVTGPIYYYDLHAQKLLKHLGIFIQSKLAGRKKRPRFLAGANMAIRKSVWQEISPKLCYKNNIHEDLDLAVHLLESKYVIAYDNHMLVATSARRLRGDSQDFYKYMRAYSATYALHNISNLSIKIPILCFMPLHFMTRMFKTAKHRVTRVKAFEKY